MTPLLSALFFAAALTLIVLIPDIAELLDTKTLMVRVIARKVAVGLEADGGVSAGKHKLFVVTHDDL